MKSENKGYERCPTGIEGMDELIEGGFPRERTVLLRGECGTGKTIFGAQFLYNGIVEHNEPGVLVCLEQDPEHLKKDMVNLNLDLDTAERNGKLMIIDASLSRVTPLEFQQPAEEIPSKSFQIKLEYFGDITTLINTIIKATKKINAKRVVIDSLPSLSYLILAENYVRNTILNINHKLITNKLTSLLISDTPQKYGESKLDVTEFIADSVITLHYNLLPKEGGRYLIINKMRGTNHSEEINLLKITKGKGITVTSPRKSGNF